MMRSRALWISALFVASSLIGGLEAADDPKVKEGLEVGNEVPISRMRAVVGKVNDRNTCLAGLYRDNRTVSIYARSSREPQLAALAKKLEALLAANKELRGYVLLLEGSQNDKKYKAQLKEWAREQGLSKVDVAITNENPAEAFGIGKERGVVVVYSDKLKVKYHKSADAGKLTEAMVKEWLADLEKLAR